MHQPGIEVRPIVQMTGDAEFCEVFLDDAIVHADGLLGTLHDGWRVATSVLADERAAVGAAVGHRFRLHRSWRGVRAVARRAACVPRRRSSVEPLVRAHVPGQGLPG